MMTKEIPWEVGGGKITVNIDDTDNKIKILSVSSTPNDGDYRSQTITITLTNFPNIKKSFLVNQPGKNDLDGGFANTIYNDENDIVDCSTEDSILGNDKLYDSENA